MTDDLVARLNAGLDEEEEWARAASQPYVHAVGNPVAPSGGVHWRWGIGENWTPVEPELGRDIIGDYGFSSQLLTAETWPTQTGHEMPRPYTHQIVEMDSAAAGHIVRHDPARVLRRIAAIRAILALHEPQPFWGNNPPPLAGRTPENVKAWYCQCQCPDGVIEGEYPCETVRVLAAVYSSDAS